MAVFRFSALSDGQSLVFNPNADVLNFDQTTIAAADLRVTTVGTSIRVDVVSGPQTGKDVTLTNVSQLQLATTNVTFADGSKLLFGDNSTAQNDNLANSLTGTAGRDLLQGFGGADTMSGGAGNDTYIVGTGDVLSDTGGVDTVVTDVSWTLAAGFENITMTGTGNISATGNNDGNFVIGNAGNNYFNMRAGNDTIQAGAGNDWIDMSAFGTASYGNDLIDGGDGTDTVNFAISAGQQSAITVDLGPGFINGGGVNGTGIANVTSIEHVIGAGFNDSIKGGFVAETLEGREGNDTLSGMAGNDTLIGGTGQDTFLFAANATGVANADVVADFVSATDKLTFDNFVFTGMGPTGNFAAEDARFASGAGLTSGQDASDRLIYNTTTGQLFYDADGNGAGAAQLVATLQGRPAVTATDIAVVGNDANTNQGTPGNDNIIGTEGNDSISGLGGDDTIAGLGGNDTLDGGAGVNFVSGGLGDDSLVGGNAFDELDGDDGNDTLIGGGGDDDLDGGSGSNQVFGGDGNDFIVAAGDDRIDGGAGDDQLLHVTFGDSVDGGAGVDFVDLMGSSMAVNLASGSVTNPAGTASATLLNVENLQRTADGVDSQDDHDFSSDNYVIGSSADNDLKISGAGFDTLDGGLGHDTLGGFSDVYTFSVVAGSADADVITSFGSAGKVQLDAPVYANVGPVGNFVEGDARFVAGAGLTSGQDASDRIVYNTTTGQLFYDADGNGTGAAQLIATLQDAPALSATSIAVIDSRLSGPIEGTAGDDWRAGADGFVNDVFHGNGGNDRFEGRKGNDTIDGGDANDTLDGGAGVDLIVGGAGNDVLKDTIEFDDGTRPAGVADTLDGGLGDDTYELHASLFAPTFPQARLFDVILRDAGGTDTVVVDNSWTLEAGFENLTLRASEDLGFGFGNAANNVITTEGRALLDGGDGDDTLIGSNLGGDGDVFQFTQGSGNYGHDTVDGRDGTDQITFANAQSAIVVNVAAGTLTGGGANGSGSVTFTNVEEFIGGSFDDLISADGTSGFHSMSGGSGDDTLIGGSGGDFLQGGDGTTVMAGGAGNDTISTGFGSHVIEFTVAPSAENVDLVFNFTSGKDKFVLDSTAFANAGPVGNFAPGDARFFAAAGATAGHDADDRVIYNTTTKQLFYDANGNGPGSAQLIASELQNTSTLAATDFVVDNGSAPGGQTITGTAGDDRLTGTEGDDSIAGLAGNDSLSGLGSNDTLDGGDGNDELNGGDGNDSMVGGAGNDLFDAVTGSGSGVDTMVGGAGDDFYLVTAGDVIVEGAGGGIDQVVASSDWTLAPNVENLRFGAPGSFSGTGNELNNALEASGADAVTLNGAAGNDFLLGESAADMLIGSAGIDTLIGGFGDDTYVVDASDELHDDGGIDTVVTDVSWTLGADFENLTMTGTGNISVTGHNGANLAVGNSGNNYFNLRAGNDTIQAGAGNDWNDMSAFGTASYGNDSIDGGAGTDTVNFAISAGQQSAIVADLTLGTIRGGGVGGAGSATVTSVEHVIGAGFNDSIKGSAAAETLEGREGNDTLSGMGGNDTLVGGTGTDSFVFAAAPSAGNVDLISDFVSGADKAAFDNAVFTALGADGNFVAGDARFAAGAGFTSGHDASDRIVYNTTTGQLFYDADGSGAGAAQLVATFQGAPAIAATDITVL